MDENTDALVQKARLFGRKVASNAANKENILVAAHHDADGLSSAAIISDFILRQGGHCLVRTTSEPSQKFLERVSASKFGLVIFADICSGLSSELARRFGDRWLIIDNHEILEEEMKDERILNPWQFGIDGGKQISTTGLAYLMTENSRDSRYAFLAVVGALGDKQDIGPRRSLIGLNSKILEEDSESFKTIESRVDMLFWAKESRPAHESISNTVTCYIPGLTGNKDACLASLRGAGLDLKVGNRWKTISNFAEEEKQQLLESIVPHLAGTTNTVEDLVGTVYCMSSQDEYSSMRDARDVVMMLNACGRMNKSSLGISLCFEAQFELSDGVDQVFSDYRSELIRSVQSVLSSQERIQEKSDYLLAVGDGIVQEHMTGAVCQVISSYNRARSKVTFLRTTTVDGDVKVSARLGKESPDYDLGSMMMQVAKSTGGVGGGHENAAGARFSIVKQQEFQVAVDRLFPQNRLKAKTLFS